MNILFITADQWRGECLGAMGHPVVRTPNLDALAAEGTLFRRHFCNTAPCSPSRTSIHTGLYQFNHRVCLNGTPMDSRFTTWALEMRGAGHDPVLFGYTDTAMDPRTMAAGDRRLTTYEEILPGIRPVVNLREQPEPWADWLAGLGYDLPSPLFDLYLKKQPGTEYEDGGREPLALAIPAEHHDTHFMVDRTMEWITNRRGRPWVAHLSLLRPHPPFIAPEPYNRMYDPATIPGFIRAETRAEEAARHPWLDWFTKDDRYAIPDDEKKLRRIKASYYGLMSEVDDNLGRLFTYLKETGQWDDTLIIVTPDHGEQMGDHWLASKTGFFDQSYHVPMIVRDPRPEADGARGAQVDAFTENVDIMPTMLDFLGLPVPPQCDGFSLLPLVQTGAAPRGWREEAFWEYDFRNILDPAMEERFGLTPHQCCLAVVRTATHKYVHFAGLPPLLFDLVTDPGEMVNLADDPAHAGTLATMARRMLSRRMTHTDRTLTETYLTGDGPVTRRTPLRRMA